MSFTLVREHRFLGPGTYIGPRLMAQQDLANMQGLLTGLNLPDLMATQGLIMDEKIKTALTVTSTNTGGSEEGKYWKSILESKAITDLSPLDDSKTYRDWNRKFKNAFEQTRPHSRKILSFVESYRISPSTF